MTAVPSRSDNPALGMALVAVGMALFTCLDTSAKWLVTAGFAALQVAFVRYLVHFVLSLAVLLPREGPSILRSVRPKAQILRSLALLGSTLMNFTALIHLPLTVATAILFAQPIAVTVLSVPLLGERVGRHRIAAVLVGFAGVLVVIRPWGAAVHWAMLLSVGAMLSGALYLILTRRIAGAERTGTSQIWSSGLATLVLAPVALPLWRTPDAPVDWLVLGLVGLFGGLGHTLVTIAARFAPAATLSPMTYFQLVYATVASVAVFGVWPDPATLLGAAIIVGSGLYIWRREKALALRRRQAAIAPR